VGLAITTRYGALLQENSVRMHCDCSVEEINEAHGSSSKG
jgi:hypothetical protein